MTESKGSKRYGKPPKITEKDPPGDDNKSANMQDAKGEAEKTADAEGNSTTTDPSDGAAPEAGVTSGTDGIPVQDRHVTELGEMMDRHRDEMSSMHDRHVGEHKNMMKRHMAEFE